MIINLIASEKIKMKIKVKGKYIAIYSSW